MNLLVIATGQPAPSGEAGDRSYDVSSLLLMIDVGVGWEPVFWERFVVRVALGVAATVGARTEAVPDFTPRSPLLFEGFTGYAETDLDGLYILCEPAGRRRVEADFSAGRVSADGSRAAHAGRRSGSLSLVRARGASS